MIVAAPGRDAYPRRPPPLCTCENDVACRIFTTSCHRQFLSALWRPEETWDSRGVSVCVRSCVCVRRGAWSRRTYVRCQRRIPLYSGLLRRRRLFSFASACQRCASSFLLGFRYATSSYDDMSLHCEQGSARGVGGPRVRPPVHQYTYRTVQDLVLLEIKRKFRLRHADNRPAPEDTASGACLPLARPGPHAAASGTPPRLPACPRPRAAGPGAPAAACPAAPESAAVKVVATGGFNTPAGNLPVKVDVPATGNAQQTKGGLQLPVPH